MEALGINVGYLVMQVLGIAVCITLLVVIAYFALRPFFRAGNGEKVMTLSVTAEGVIIPAELLPEGGQVEIWQDGETVIVKRQKS